MNKFEYKNLTPFKWFVLENFPFIEADFDALTEWQLFCKLEKEINKIINSENTLGTQMENITNAFIELQNYVNNYFDNLNVQDEINKKLNEMAESGELTEIIINSILNKNTPQTMNNLLLNRIMRTFERNANSPEHVSEKDYASMQGGAYTGNNKMVIARIRNNIVNDTLLQEISLDSGLTLRETKLQLNHANSIAYNPNTNKLYITSLLMEDNSQRTPLQLLYIINYTTFELEQTISLDLPVNEGLHSISYDILLDKYYIASEDFQNNNSLKFYELNISNYNLTEILLNDYTSLLNKSYNNDILVYNNYLYVLKHQPQVILCFNLETKNLFNVYNIENISNGIAVGELENISIKYDDFSKSFILSSNRTECTNGFYNIFQYYNANVFYNNSINIQQNWGYIEKTLFVDINSSSLNPDGSSTNKFKHIAEALEYAQQFSGNTSIQISSGIYPFVDYKGNKNRVELRPISGTNDVTIQGLKLQCGNFFITNLTIENKSSLQKYDIYADFCKLRISLLVLNGTNDYAIYARRCDVDFFQLSYNNTLFYCQTETTLFCHDDIPSFNYGNQKPYYTTPIKLINGIQVRKELQEQDISKFAFPIKQKGIIRINFYGYYNRGYIEFNHDGTETIRNFSLNINRYSFELAMNFNYNNNKIGLKVLQAYLLNANGSVTNILDNVNLLITPYLL